MIKDTLMGTAIILTDRNLEKDHCKTAHGLIRGTERFDIQGVIDPENAGCDAGEVLDGIYRDIPVFSTISAFIEATGNKPDYALIGVALSGGKLDEKSIVIELRNFISMTPGPGQ